MKKLEEAAPGDVAALRRRTIRALANDEINDEDCTYITSRLNEIGERVKNISERRLAHGHQ